MAMALPMTFIALVKSRSQILNLRPFCPNSSMNAASRKPPTAPQPAAVASKPVPASVVAEAGLWSGS